jgi:hypothetical protein
VFVHGLQGHPVKTWTWIKDASLQPERRTPSPSGAQAKPARSLLIPRKDNRNLTAELPESNAAFSGPNDVFWPFDLLPNGCPDARILT